jgi:hypothetical protein
MLITQQPTAGVQHLVEQLLRSRKVPLLVDCYRLGKPLESVFHYSRD